MIQIDTLQNAIEMVPVELDSIVDFGRKRKDCDKIYKSLGLIVKHIDDNYNTQFDTAIIRDVKLDKALFESVYSTLNKDGYALLLFESKKRKEDTIIKLASSVGFEIIENSKEHVPNGDIVEYVFLMQKRQIVKSKAIGIPKINRDIPPICNKWSERCDTIYAKSGLSMPQCCYEHMKEILFFTVDVLDKNGIKYWIDFHTLRNALVSEEFSPSIEDVFIGIFYEDLDKLKDLKDSIAASGFFLKEIVMRRKRWFKLQYSKNNEIGVIIDLWMNLDGEMVIGKPSRTKNRAEAEYTFPCSFVKEFSEVKLEGRMVKTVGNPKLFIEHRYGPGWEIGQQKTRADANPRKIKPIKSSKINNVTTNTIWMYWDGKKSGDVIPPIYQLCMRTVKQHGGKMNVVTVNEDNISQYLPGVLDEISSIKNPKRRSEFIRTKLLYIHGGVWFDNDVVVRTPIENIVSPLEQYDCICSNMFYGEPYVCFLASRIGSPLIGAWLEHMNLKKYNVHNNDSLSMYDGLQQTTETHDYFSYDNSKFEPIPSSRAHFYLTDKKHVINKFCKHVKKRDSIFAFHLHGATTKHLLKMTEDEILSSNMLVSHLLKMSLGI